MEIHVCDFWTIFSRIHTTQQQVVLASTGNSLYSKETIPRKGQLFDTMI